MASAPKVEYEGRRNICVAAASTISLRPYPMLQYQRLAVASRYLLPASSTPTSVAPFNDELVALDISHVREWMPESAMHGGAQPA